MSELEYQRTYSTWISQGIEAVESGNTALALKLFSAVRPEDLSPLASSYLAYCLARERKMTAKAVNMALKAIQAERSHPLLYLNLGRIYMAMGNSRKALQVYRQGLKYQQNPLLLRHIALVCPRKPSPIPF